MNHFSIRCDNKQMRRLDDLETVNAAKNRKPTGNDYLLHVTHSHMYNICWKTRKILFFYGHKCVTLLPAANKLYARILNSAPNGTADSVAAI